MRRNNKLSGTYFCGNEASDYAKENGFLDYATLAKAFDAVLNNDIIRNTSDIGYWDIENGSEYWDIENGSEEYYEDNDGNRYTYDEKEERIEELETKIREYEDTINEVMERDEDYEENHVYIAMNENISRIKEEIEALEDAHYKEIFQYFIISDNGAEILKDYTDEIVFYNEALDMYVWGVTHWGTIWDYVLTDIRLNCGEEAYN